MDVQSLLPTDERNEMKLTKRGKKVRAVAILIGIYLVYQVICNLWYVGPGFPTEDFIGYCWGDMIACTMP